MNLQFEITNGTVFGTISGKGFFFGYHQRSKGSPFFEAFKDNDSYCIRVGHRELVVDRWFTKKKAAV